MGFRNVNDKNERLFKNGGVYDIVKKKNQTIELSKNLSEPKSRQDLFDRQLSDYRSGTKIMQKGSVES